MRVFLPAFAALTFALSAALPAGAVPAPHVSVSSLAELEVPDTPFDAGRDANADVDAALARAKKSGKRVLIDLGGNWCADCRILSGLMELPEMRAFLAAHYEIATVDVGRFNRNLQIPARWGITTRLAGVPALLVVTPDGKTLVNAGRVSAIQDARHFTPQALADWLAQWTA
ncbi:MAG: thioredoxin family protein [Alphaproteobacteria bacterium]|nr:thioredoxin family protein [Alphaproteobacteria bacterium]